MDLLVTLYGWKGGCRLDDALARTGKGLFPGETYHFPPLNLAAAHFGFFDDVAANFPWMAPAVDRLFPIFWNGSDSWFAVDLEDAGAVVAVRFDPDRHFTPAYASLVDMLLDIIRANDEDTPISFFREGGKPVGHFEVRPRVPKTVARRRLASAGNSLVVRTDFADEEAWRALREEIEEPRGEFGFTAHVEFVDAPDLAGLTPERLIADDLAEEKIGFLFLVDRVTLDTPEHPVLVVDLRHEPGRTFRVVASEMWGVENNLSLGNMDFAEFADAAVEDGVFRGWPE
ncbi:DUF6924 domain-containing protein [Aquisphaera insulae]|uniref:DUF6924 domain-containing protein n=1 Tax=Aquisphaera insulae TaxID=2712864 RepID=UPI00196A89E3|nr:hypothetical protein [Aquisphaera insulae]